MKTYIRGKYQVTESDWIRIGMSNVYVFERVETPLDDNGNPNPDDGVFPRIIFILAANSGSCEIDPYETPYKDQATELVKLFSKYL